MNWKCLLGFHHWRHSDQLTIGGQRYVSPHGNEVIVGRRTIYFRCCERCDKEGQYYPSKQQLVEIIRTRQRIACRITTHGGADMSVDYKYLGNFAACEPWAAQGMSCDDCMVSWTGCWDNFQCPKCGNGELPWNPVQIDDDPFALSLPPSERT